MSASCAYLCYSPCITDGIMAGREGIRAIMSCWLLTWPGHRSSGSQSPSGRPGHCQHHHLHLPHHIFCTTNKMSHLTCCRTCCWWPCRGWRGCWTRCWGCPSSCPGQPAGCAGAANIISIVTSIYVVSLKTIMLCSSGLDAWLSFHYSNQTFRIFIEIKFSVEQHQLCKNTRNFI